jgi:hypothetical protein
MSIDDEAQALLERWRAQNAMPKSPHIGEQDFGTDQSPHLFQQGADPQSTDQTPVDPVNSVRPMGPPIAKAPRQNPQLGQVEQTKVYTPTSGPMPSQKADICSQCGIMHPPLQPGEICPNAPIKQKDGNPNSLDDVTVNKHLVDMRNIIFAQISSKKIKNEKKFFQYAVVELTKALESYNEETN